MIETNFIDVCTPLALFLNLDACDKVTLYEFFNLLLKNRKITGNRNLVTD